MHEMKITFIDQKHKPLASPRIELPFSFRFRFFFLFVVVFVFFFGCCIAFGVVLCCWLTSHVSMPSLIQCINGMLNHCLHVKNAAHRAKIAVNKKWCSDLSNYFHVGAASSHAHTHTILTKIGSFDSSLC